MSRIDKIIIGEKEEDIYNSTVFFRDAIESRTKQAIEYLKTNEKKSVEIIARFNTIIDKISNTNTLHYIWFNHGYIYFNVGNNQQDIKYIEKAYEFFLKIEPEKLRANFLDSYFYRYARILYVRFQLFNEKKSNFVFLPDNIVNLLQAKKFLFKLYKKILEGKKLKSLNKKDIIEDLIIILTQIGRWSEAYYYLSLLPDNIKSTPYVLYLKVCILSNYKKLTCTNTYKVIDYKINKYSKEAKEKGLPKIITQILDGYLEENPISSEDLKIQQLHEIDNDKKNTQYSSFRNFVTKNQLQLNEHLFFCNCDLAFLDDLKIITNHPHTACNWVMKLEPIMTEIIREYHFARLNYFYSIHSENISDFQEEIKLPVNAFQNNFYLINAFKLCFSILDKIALLILEIYDIESKNNISFFNWWRNNKDAIISKTSEPKYISALYSIVCDLQPNTKDPTKDFSVFPEYKKWRNDLEHKFLFISDNQYNNSGIKNNIVIVKKDEIESKTLNLLHLCKSAIFSAVFLIRRESITKSKE